MKRKIVTAILLFSFIIIAFTDAVLNDKMTYSSIMGMDISRVYFYTFYLLAIGCWLLYNQLFVGIGFITLATFNSFFIEFSFIHNYFASIVIYIGLLVDILMNRKAVWLIPFLLFGIIQGISFEVHWISKYFVGCMEFISLFAGSIFLIKKI
jgi:hypothetical protein